MIVSFLLLSYKDKTINETKTAVIVIALAIDINAILNKFIVNSSMSFICYRRIFSKKQTSFKKLSVKIFFQIKKGVIYELFRRGFEDY